MASALVKQTQPYYPLHTLVLSPSNP